MAIGQFFLCRPETTDAKDWQLKNLKSFVFFSNKIKKIVKKRWNDELLTTVKSIRKYYKYFATEHRATKLINIWCAKPYIQACSNGRKNEVRNERFKLNWTTCRTTEWNNQRVFFLSTSMFAINFIMLLLLLLLMMTGILFQNGN